MKKLLITSLFTLSMMASVSANETFTISNEASIASPSMRAAVIALDTLPIVMTGDATIDAKIKALHVDMETQMKVLHADYQTKLKALIGDMKTVRVMIKQSTRGEIGSTTATSGMPIRKEIQAARVEIMKDLRQEIKATTSKSLGGFFNIFRGFFNGEVQR